MKFHDIIQTTLIICQIQPNDLGELMCEIARFTISGGFVNLPLRLSNFIFFIIHTIVKRRLNFVLMFKIIKLFQKLFIIHCMLLPVICSFSSLGEHTDTVIFAHVV